MYCPHCGTMKMQRAKIFFSGASAISEAINFKNGSFMFRSRSGEVVQCFAESKHPILELSLPVEAEMLPVFNRQVSSRGTLSNVVLWTYSLVGDAGSTKFIIRRKLTVNIIMWFRTGGGKKKNQVRYYVR